MTTFSGLLWEAVKELGRTAILVFVGSILATLSAGQPLSKAALLSAVTAALGGVLRGLDRYIHESTDIKANGLIPF